MNPKQATRLIATGAIVTAAIIAWRHVKSTNTAPPPSAFLYPTALFGGLALVADVGAPGLAAALAGALTIGIGFRVVEAGSAPRAAAVPARSTSSRTRTTTSRRPPARRVNVRKG